MCFARSQTERSEVGESRQRMKNQRKLGIDMEMDNCTARKWLRSCIDSGSSIVGDLVAIQPIEPRYKPVLLHVAVTNILLTIATDSACECLRSK